MRAILSIIMSVVLSGCVLKDEYPTSWGALPSKVDTGCQDVSGVYGNVGENTLENGEHHLAQILVPGYSSNFEAEQVRIEVQEKKFQVTLYNNSGGASEAVIGLYEGLMCNNGVYQITRNTFANSGGAIGKQWLSYKIQSNDDSLILKRTQGVLGALFFIPVAGKETHWLRFGKP